MGLDSVGERTWMCDREKLRLAWRQIKPSYASRLYEIFK